MSEDDFRPEFDLGAFRYAVAKYVKLLIRARWKDNPGFLSAQALTDWGLLKINDDRILDNRIPTWRLMEEAAQALGVLNNEFIPRCGSGGIRIMTGDTSEIRLMNEIAFLAAWNGGGPYHNRELLTAATNLREGRAIDWNELVNWPRLPTIRADLDRLPHPRRGEAADVAGQYVFRWQSERNKWDIVFDGKSILVHDSVGLFYLGELLNKSGKIVTASELRRAHAAWRSDPESFIRRHAENAALSRLKAQGDDGDSNEMLGSPGQDGMLGSPGQDLGEVLDAEGRANFKSLIAKRPAEIESLRSLGKTAQAIELERELEDMKRAVRVSLDLGGRPEKMSDVYKKDRDAVCKAIRRTLEELRTAGPLFHTHLQKGLKLGRNCCYCPETPPIWNG